MFLVVLFGLMALAAAVLLVVLVAGAVAGASTGAALGGTLAGNWPARRLSSKADPTGLAAGWRRALFIVLGIFAGGLVGGLAGIGLVAVILVLIVAAG